jgi:hypothetical protein
MSIFKKITGKDSNPGRSDGRFIVYSKQFNDLIDNLKLYVLENTAAIATAVGDYLPLAGGTMDSGANIRLNSNHNGGTTAGELIFGYGGSFSPVRFQYDLDASTFFKVHLPEQRFVMYADEAGPTEAVLDLDLDGGKINSYPNGFGGTARGTIILGSNTLTAPREWTMPDATGTVALDIGGVTGSRPSTPHNYQTYFDTTIGKPIWYNGAAWVDATGATV